MGLNKPVDFTTAKLLKEKWFNKPTSKYFRYDGKECENKPLNWNEDIGFFSRPTIADVLMWCFNKYKYSIEYSMNIPESGEYDACYVFNGLIKGSEDYKLKIFYTSKDYPTAEKALEDTINHFLINFC